jgi:hypothetical protein
MPIFPEFAPEGQDHILGSSVRLHGVNYAKGTVRYAERYPAEATLKLSFTPKTVQLNGRDLAKASGEGKPGWSFDPARHVLVVRADAGEVKISN